MKVDISTPIRLNDFNYQFHVYFDGALFVPGFRTYMGKIEVPKRKNKSNWYPVMYMDSETAAAIYDALLPMLPQDTLSANRIRAIGDMIVDSSILARFETA